MKQAIPRISITFKEPTAGFWDGGKKSGGTFKPEACTTYLLTSAKGNDYTRRIYKNEYGQVKWGCFELNFWFRANFGDSWEQAIVKAKAKIKRMCRVPCKLEVSWKEA